MRTPLGMLAGSILIIQPVQETAWNDEHWIVDRLMNPCAIK